MNNNDTITLPTEVVKQALDAFEADDWQKKLQAAIALRAALEQPQVEQELVSKIDNYLNGYCAGRTDLLKEQQREQEERNG